MSWRDQLARVDFEGRQLVGATFRGVPFFVDASELSGGRRTVTHEYPHRDEPYVQDLGRAARAFTVEGYVIGEEYLRGRDLLVGALEASGSGRLVHPYHGVVQVICTTFRLRESIREGGLARFAIDFSRTEETPRQPVATPATAELVASSADAAVVAVGEDFTDTYDVEDQPVWAVSAISALLVDVSEAMNGLLGPVMTDAQALAQVTGQLAALGADAVELVRAPSDLVDALAAVFGALQSSVMQSRRGLDALLGIATASPGEARPEGTTSTRARQGSNYDALLALVRRGAIVQAARLAPGEQYDSYEDAVAVRDNIAGALDGQMETAGDSAYSALQQLRADLVRSLPGPDSPLARLVSYTPPVTVPSLVLAHRLYGTIDREQDIVARNYIPTPGFVLGGQALEVLADE